MHQLDSKSTCGMLVTYCEVVICLLTAPNVLPLHLITKQELRVHVGCENLGEPVVMMWQYFQRAFCVVSFLSRLLRDCEIIRYD